MPTKRSSSLYKKLNFLTETRTENPIVPLAIISIAHILMPVHEFHLLSLWNHTGILERHLAIENIGQLHASIGQTTVSMALLGPL